MPTFDEVISNIASKSCVFREKNTFLYLYLLLCKTVLDNQCLTGGVWSLANHSSSADETPLGEKNSPTPARWFQLRGKGNIGFDSVT